MALTDNKKIAIWATAKAACQMLWSARKQHMALAFMTYLPFPIISVIAGRGFAATSAVLTAFWIILWIYPLQLLWQRLFLVGPDFYLKVTVRKMSKMLLRFMAYYIGLFGSVIAATVIFIIAASLLAALWHFTLGFDDKRAIAVVFAITILASIIFCLTAFMRFVPTFMSIPVEENISLHNSWITTKGNTAPLLMTILLIFIPMILLNLIITVLLGMASGFITGQEFSGFAGHHNIWTSLGFLLLSPLITAGGAISTAAMAIIYRDLVPQPEHLVDVNV